jgi:hypothetical protein
MRSKKNKILTKTRKNKKEKNKTRNKIKMKGGNNPFSDIFGMWGTMTYNLSNALSVFTITPPPGHMNQPNIMDPSPGKQFL